MAETLQIGALELKSRALAAPMAGVSDIGHRLLCARMGAGLTVTEMVSSKGLIQKNRKTTSLARSHPEGRPCSVQLFGADAHEMEEAARMVEESGADAIDVNMGCPVKKVVRVGAGGALLKTPDRAARIVAAIRKVVAIPLTVKMRAGFSHGETKAVELAKRLVAEGADAVAIHPRTVAQGYGGSARWEIIGEAVSALDAPVIGSGDIINAADALAMTEQTGCAGVMAGRATMGNPFIFRQIAAILDGRPAPRPPGMEERLKVAMEHLDILLDFWPQKPAIWQWRKHFCQYAKGIPGAVELRRRVFHIEDPDELRAMAVQFFTQGEQSESPNRRPDTPLEALS